MTVKVEPLETVVSGPFRAWHLDHRGALAQAGIDVDSDASIASWIVQAPWAHPAWHSYWLYVCHLRPMPDDRLTKFYLEGATHELWLYALDPKAPLQQMIDEAMPRFLTPINFAAQLICDDDDAAKALLRGAALDVLHQRINPDTDAISQWWARFGDNMRRKGL